ncbi:hypothetical protein DIPPA_09929 [Diplonema papillatum]|nr:hypothetical protein DIPPA_09929 [Diplonema papillatum]
MPEVRKRCPHCDFSWLDKYGKNECPKCSQPLSVGGPSHQRQSWATGAYTAQQTSGLHGAARIQPGEASTFKQSASSAMESAGGACPKGGPHMWKFGKCSKCGRGEGYGGGAGVTAVRRPSGASGACAEGKHKYKFGKCTACGRAEF